MDNLFLNCKDKWLQMRHEMKQELHHFENQCRCFWQHLVSTQKWEPEVIHLQSYRKQKTLNELTDKFIKDDWNILDN